MEKSQKAACTNKLWLIPQNVIGLDIWHFRQIKLVVRAFKNNQNLKIVKMWVSPLVHDAIQLSLDDYKLLAALPAGAHAKVLD